MNPHAPHGAHEAVAGSLSIVPMIGSVFLLLLLVLAGLYLWRRGWLTLPNLGRRRSPEDDAKHIFGAALRQRRPHLRGVHGPFERAQLDAGGRGAAAPFAQTRSLTLIVR